ncbi:peptidase [Streptomyces mashuensis]|uniref:Peptidase n=1 Tax=Streptomyces mashuensis TaxID=33904 RepID=A0A919B2D7_9ACTN|nr:peptidoglycan DD-metalloendopeptidase family protein [Streptomyces mashuensis]GHF42795.1 peptidase [Streptomyces mashuensis]
MARWALSLAGLSVLCVAVCPLFGAAPSVAGRTSKRLASVGSEVVRLAREESRIQQGYEDGLREAGGHRRLGERLARELRQEELVRAALLQDAGAVARAQYRTGGFTAHGSMAVAEDPVELLELQSTDTARRQRLARMLIEADGRRQALASGRLSATVSLQTVSAGVSALRGEKEAVTRRLARARAELNSLADAAVRTGQCEPVDLGGLQNGARALQDGANGAGGVSAAGWTRPLLSYQLSAGFGGTGAHWSGHHSGQDFAVPTGTPVRSVGAGTVLFTGCGGPFGMSLVVQHDGGWFSQYAHLAATLPAPGTRVRAGDWIGLSGTTGNSTGPHLHFEVRRTPDYGSAVEPVRWLRARGVVL